MPFSPPLGVWDSKTGLKPTFTQGCITLTTIMPVLYTPLICCARNLHDHTARSPYYNSTYNNWQTRSRRTSRRPTLAHGAPNLRRP